MRTLPYVIHLLPVCNDDISYNILPKVFLDMILKVMKIFKIHNSSILQLIELHFHTKMLMKTVHCWFKNGNSFVNRRLIAHNLVWSLNITNSLSLLNLIHLNTLNLTEEVKSIELVKIQLFS